MKKKKKETNNFYSGAKGIFSMKRTKAFTNGEIFTFEIQVRRKNGKIYLKEISNNRSIYSLVSESVREDNISDVMLAKAHIINELVMKIEKGFNRKENPIGGRKVTDSANDSLIKKVA
jgi:type IV secretory pathway VirB9-like protein